MHPMEAMEQFLSLATFDRIGTAGAMIIMAGLVITDKLVWHKRLEKAENRADRWEKVAIDALTAGAQAGVRAAEVAVDVVSAIPDPRGTRSSASDSASEKG